MGAGEAGRDLREWINERLEDPSGALREAVQRAHVQSWQVVELALAGDRLSGRFRAALSSGQVKGVVAPLERVITARGPELRERALRELRQARQSGPLDRPLQRLPADETDVWQRFDAPQGFIDAAWEAMRGLAQELHRAGCTHLALLVGTPIRNQSPLFLSAFGYFLRREVANDPKLASELNSDPLQRIWRDQEEGLGRLREDLERWDEASRLELSQVAAGLDRVEERVGATHEAVLDLRQASPAPKARRGNWPARCWRRSIGWARRGARPRRGSASPSTARASGGWCAL